MFKLINYVKLTCIVVCMQFLVGCGMVPIKYSYINDIKNTENTEIKISDDRPESEKKRKAQSFSSICNTYIFGKKNVKVPFGDKNFEPQLVDYVKTVFEQNIPKALSGSVIKVSSFQVNVNMYYAMQEFQSAAAAGASYGARSAVYRNATMPSIAGNKSTDESYDYFECILKGKLNDIKFDIVQRMRIYEKGLNGKFNVYNELGHQKMQLLIKETVALAVKQALNRKRSVNRTCGARRGPGAGSDQDKCLK